MADCDVTHLSSSSCAVLPSFRWWGRGRWVCQSSWSSGSTFLPPGGDPGAVQPLPVAPSSCAHLGPWQPPVPPWRERRRVKWRSMRTSECCLSKNEVLKARGLELVSPQCCHTPEPSWSEFSHLLQNVVPLPGSLSSAGRRWWTGRPTWHCAPCAEPEWNDARTVTVKGSQIRKRSEIKTQQLPHLLQKISSDWPHRICGWPVPAWSGILWGQWWALEACTLCPDSKRCSLLHVSHRWGGQVSWWCRGHYRKQEESNTFLSFTNTLEGTFSTFINTFVNYAFNVHAQ